MEWQLYKFLNFSCVTSIRSLESIALSLLWSSSWASFSSSGGHPYSWTRVELNAQVVSGLPHSWNSGWAIIIVHHHRFSSLSQTEGSSPELLMGILLWVKWMAPPLVDILILDSNWGRCLSYWWTSSLLELRLSHKLELLLGILIGFLLRRVKITVLFLLLKTWRSSTYLVHQYFALVTCTPPRWPAMFGHHPCSLYLSTVCQH